MLILLVSAALLAVCQGQWYNGACGDSKYPDAANQPLPSGKMIVGGVAAREFEFPWQASLRRLSTNSHFCGGSIINANWIVSAAHCCAGETPAIMSIVIGDHTRNDNSNTVRKTLRVERIVSHPQYNSRTLVNDICLIRVSDTIAFNQNVQPICAPSATNQYVHRKTSCSGWGTLSSGGACCPQTLQYVNMNITTNAYCDTAYPRDAITADMICATDNTGSRDRDSCQGDSGGPLKVQESNGKFTLVGIVSWGIGCASGYPGVYARVSHFLAWIAQTIG